MNKLHQDVANGKEKSALECPLVKHDIGVELQGVGYGHEFMDTAMSLYSTVKALGKKDQARPYLLRDIHLHFLL